jgi:hypothetical protein
LGEASQRPAGSDDAITRNGDNAMKLRQCRSSRVSCFLTARSIGSP